MTLASLARTRLLRATAAFLVALGALVLIPGSDTATAAGTPNVALTKSAPGEALAGDTAIPVTLTATNTSGATDGFNLTFVTFFNRASVSARANTSLKKAKNLSELRLKAI